MTTEAASYIGVPLFYILFAIAFSRYMECAVMEGVKTVPDDPLVAEAYSVCDKPNSYHRSQLRGIVDGFAQRIQACRESQSFNAEREERRRLSQWIHQQRMGS